MRPLWDFRPPEFVALPPAERKRVWNRCYWRALRSPRLLGPLVLLGAGLALVMVLAQMFIGRSSSGWGSAARYGLFFFAQIALTFVFAKYAVYVMRDALRACAVGCCLNCWYDLTGNESGICPECGTPRAPSHV